MFPKRKGGGIPIFSIGILCLILTLTFCENSSSTSKEIEEFQTLFQQKRLHQLNAVKQLLNMSPKNQINLLDTMMSKMKAVLTESKTSLTKSSLELSEGNLPSDQMDKTYLALVLENVCLASDILLRFPNYMLKKLKEDKELDTMYKWGLLFVNETVSYVMDKPTKRLFFLAGQEIELIERDANYVNPYKKVESEPKKIMFTDKEPSVNKKPRKKLKKGPRLSKSE